MLPENTHATIRPDPTRAPPSGSAVRAPRRDRPLRSRHRQTRRDFGSPREPPVSPAAAADLERILYLARALQDSPERSEIEQRAVAALERVALLEQIARLADVRESSTEIERAYRLRAALAELAQE